MSDRLEQFEQYRAMLFAMAYRMLGSFSDAEDMVQEAFLRWHKAKDVDVRSPKSYLATTITRLCLDHLKSARIQRESYVGPWLPEPVMTGATATSPAVFRPVGQPEEEASLAESLSIGFLVLMESLSPAERAVFLLREVFEFEFAEIAKILKKSEQNCRQLLRRARKHVAAKRPRFETSTEEQGRILQEFVRASSSGDLQGLIQILQNDVTLISDGGGKVAAALNPIYGADKVIRFLMGIMPKIPVGLISIPTEVNGVPALANYVGKNPHSVLVPEFDGGKIRAIYIISNPDKLKHLNA